MDDRINPGTTNPSLTFTDNNAEVGGVTTGTTGVSGGTIEVTAIPNDAGSKPAPANIAPDWSVKLLD